MLGGQTAAQRVTHGLDSGETNSSPRVIKYPSVTVQRVQVEDIDNQRGVRHVCKSLSHPGIFSISRCTGMVSWPRKRLMIGRLLANLSFTSMYRMSVISATNVYFCRETQEGQCLLNRAMVI